MSDKTTESLSTGQRCTEVLPILLAHTERTLLIDQPEDHLDNRMVEGLDISGADRFDARVRMLEETFLATIELLKSLDGIDPRRGIVSSELLSQAQVLVNDKSWRKSAGAEQI